MGKTDQIREVLLTTICCDKKQSKISREDNIILSGQKYYSSTDADMSNFAVGFYEIVYKDILNSKPLLKHNGSLWNNEYAGDTMNSFNTVANITPRAGKSRVQRTAMEEWPEYLQNYYRKYHCLANFWILPMEIGRTTKGILNKAINPTGDYMDRFLEMVHSKIRFYGYDREYFRCFNCWGEFTDKHFLINSYLNEELKIELYSNFNEDKSRKFIKKALEKIGQRAECIAESEYANKLWEYFNEWNLFKEIRSV
ncbi:hypothetical protein NIE88_02255 [Sporolactobacillus shoreicorticis]|uniref:Uncharacterized protein n=1 Tax=Sporolactobacillus shoreicorticis TaxID=1923877 RepID=A0ABW5S246_9BACL|nr:hypothetical protein [Sporolactobacillus shoreicorticis]MCO7124602.1 hypothetical protein [Sporolactobacillus shoreicorticis]